MPCLSPQWIHAHALDGTGEVQLLAEVFSSSKRHPAFPFRPLCDKAALRKRAKRLSFKPVRSRFLTDPWELAGRSDVRCVALERRERSSDPRRSPTSVSSSEREALKRILDGVSPACSGTGPVKPQTCGHPMEHVLDSVQVGFAGSFVIRDAASSSLWVAFQLPGSDEQAPIFTSASLPKVITPECLNPA